jgi:DNA-binding NarL/FixJ family response regulator
MPIDLVLLDLDQADAPGLGAVEEACAAHPGVPVVVVAARAGPGFAARVIAHGASGFVPKSASAATVMEAMRAVRAGEIWMPPEVESDGPVPRLTPQQFRVLHMLCAGLPNKQIGVRLGVTEATVKAHMRAIMEKFGADNRTQVVVSAQRLGIDQPAVRERRSQQNERGNFRRLAVTHHPHQQRSADH